MCANRQEGARVSGVAEPPAPIATYRRVALPLVPWRLIPLLPSGREPAPAGREPSPVGSESALKRLWHRSARQPERDGQRLGVREIPFGVTS